MNVGWDLLTGTATRYLLLAVNVCLGVFLMPYTVRHLGRHAFVSILAILASVIRRVGVSPATT